MLSVDLDVQGKYVQRRMNDEMPVTRPSTVPLRRSDRTLTIEFGVGCYCKAGATTSHSLSFTSGECTREG